MKDNSSFSFPLVSIITVNYNQQEVTYDMLKSLSSVSYPNIELIVVDNASLHFDEEGLQAQFPTVRVIRSKKNLGFAGGEQFGNCPGQR